ncbi:GNAT family N-acetyltransferase [Pedobacter sp.]|uniref:GNAT family N-acetyltransferase n=1 Tax=Pedobacter sp. TaxID=1411316 RepID=UPI003D7FC23F
MVKYILPEETLNLRSRVLRNGQPLAQCIFPTDEQGFHLGVVDNDQIVCIASFYPNDYPEKGKGGYKLRGMATAPEFAGKGFGNLLIKFAINELIAANASYIWCNARSSAIGFYTKLGFELVTEEFELPGIGMHFNMIYNLKDDEYNRSI